MGLMSSQQPELSYEKVKVITNIISNEKMVKKKGAIPSYSFFCPQHFVKYPVFRPLHILPFSVLSCTWGYHLLPSRVYSDIPSSEMPSLTSLALMWHTLLYIHGAWHPFRFLSSSRCFMIIYLTVLSLTWGIYITGAELNWWLVSVLLVPCTVTGMDRTFVNISSMNKDCLKEEWREASLQRNL